MEAVDAQGQMRMLQRRRLGAGGLEAAKGFLHWLIVLRGNRSFLQMSLRPNQSGTP